jgi:glycosidase
MVEVVGLHPQPGKVIKRKKNERLSLSVLVRSSLPHEKLIVEAWAPFHDDANKRHEAFVLSFKEKRDDGYLFTGTIKLPYTGKFPIAYRARESDQSYWTWDGNHTNTATLWVDPDWTSDAIIYNAFIRYFGAKSLREDGSINPGEGGTFEHLRKEIKKLKKMGINVIYLNPVHPIGELFRNYNPNDLLPEYLQPGCPYSIKDYKTIDPEISFGKSNPLESDHPFSEFKKLVDFAHEQGMRVFMDLVFNHAAHDAVFQRIHPEWFLYKEDIWSLEAPYLYPQEVKDGKPWGDPKHTFSPNDHGYWWNDAAQLNWNNCDQYPEHIMKNISANKPPVNPTIDEMYEYFKNIVKFYIREFGVDGFRCDVAYRVPLDFWEECIIEARQVAKLAHPENNSIDGDVVFIAESYYVMMPELLRAGFTACYGDYSHKLDTVQNLTGYLDYMYNINGDHFPEGSDWFIFPECHDFHRTPKMHADGKEHYLADLHANKSRWTITALLPGMPMIFNGFEKIEWKPASLFSYSSIDWESDKDISEHISKINHIKHEQRALQKGTYHYLHTEEGRTEAANIFSFARYIDSECIIVTVNMNVEHRAGTKVFLADDLPIDFSKPYALIDLYSGEEFNKEGNELPVILDAGEAHIFKVIQ